MRDRLTNNEALQLSSASATAQSGGQPSWSTRNNEERRRVVFVNWKLAAATVAGLLIGGISAIAIRTAEPDRGSITRSTGEAEIGGPFHLVDEHGRDFTHQDLLGKPSLLIFGYTSSPDLTPATLNVVSQALEALGTDPDRVRVVFVSLDWEGDRPDVLKTYLRKFHPSIVGLTGSEKDIRQMASAFKIHLNRRAAADGSLGIDHSQLMFALDADGNYVSHLRLPASVAAVTALLRRLTSQS